MNNIKILVLVFLIIIIISVVVYYIFKKEKFNAKHSLTQLPVQAHKQLPRQAHTHMTRQKHVQSHINRQKPVHSHVQSLTQMTRQNPRQIHRQSHVQSLTQMNRQNPRLTGKFKLGDPNSDPFKNVTIIGNMYYFNDAIENGYQSQNITSEELQELKDYLSSGPTTSDTVPSFSTDTNQEINTIGENEQSMASTKLDGHQTESTSAMDDAQSMAATGFFNALYGGFESGWTSSAVDQIALSVGLGIIEIGLAAEGLGFLSQSVAGLAGFFTTQPPPAPTIEQIKAAVADADQQQALQTYFGDYNTMLNNYQKFLQGYQQHKSDNAVICPVNNDVIINTCMKTPDTQPNSSNVLFDPSIVLSPKEYPHKRTVLQTALGATYDNGGFASLVTYNTNSSLTILGIIANGQNSLQASLMLYPSFIRTMNLTTQYYQELSYIDTSTDGDGNYYNPWASNYVGRYDINHIPTNPQPSLSILGELQYNCPLLFTYLQNMYTLFYNSIGYYAKLNYDDQDNEADYMIMFCDQSPFSNDPGWWGKMDLKYPNGAVNTNNVTDRVNTTIPTWGDLGYMNGADGYRQYVWNYNGTTMNYSANRCYHGDYTDWNIYFENVAKYMYMEAFDEKMNRPFGPNGVLSILKKQAGITWLAGEQNWDQHYPATTNSNPLVYDPSGGYPFGSAKSSYADALQGVFYRNGTVGTDLYKNGSLFSPVLNIPINDDGTYGVIDGSVFKNDGDIKNYGYITCPTGYTQIMSTLLPGASPGTSDGTITLNSRKAFCYNPKTGQTSDLINFASTFLIFDVGNPQNISDFNNFNDIFDVSKPDLSFRGYVNFDGSWVQPKVGGEGDNGGILCKFLPQTTSANYYYFNITDAFNFVTQGTETEYLLEYYRAENSLEVSDISIWNPSNNSLNNSLVPNIIGGDIANDKYNVYGNIPKNNWDFYQIAIHITIPFKVYLIFDVGTNLSFRGYVNWTGTPLSSSWVQAYGEGDNGGILCKFLTTDASGDYYYFNITDAFNFATKGTYNTTDTYYLEYLGVQGTVKMSEVTIYNPASNNISLVPNITAAYMSDTGEYQIFGYNNKWNTYQICIEIDGMIY